MPDKDINQTAGERRTAAKNKKYNKTDVIAFGICLCLAVIVWIYAVNARYNEEQSREDITPEPPAIENTEQTA